MKRLRFIRSGFWDVDWRILVSVAIFVLLVLGATRAEADEPTVVISAKQASPDGKTFPLTAVVNGAPAGAVLRYQWTVDHGWEESRCVPNDVAGAQTTIVTVDKAQKYGVSVHVYIDDSTPVCEGRSEFTVPSIPTRLAMERRQCSVAPEGTVSLICQTLDQFGDEMEDSRPTRWQVVAGGGSIGASTFGPNVVTSLDPGGTVFNAPGEVGESVIEGVRGPLSVTQKIVIAEFVPKAPIPAITKSDYHLAVLTWPRVGRADSYAVYRSEKQAPTSFHLLQDAITRPTFSDSTVKADHTYLYYVTAILDGAESEPSEQIDYSYENQPPDIVKGPEVVGGANITGVTAQLSASATDDGGPSHLKYLWSSSGPADVKFSPDGASHSNRATATFAQAGDYSIFVSVLDEDGLGAGGQVEVHVAQTPSRLVVLPAAATLLSGKRHFFRIRLQDQFGLAVEGTHAAHWAVSSGLGTLSPNGLFTAAVKSGQSVLSATYESMSAKSIVTTVPGASASSARGTESAKSGVVIVKPADRSAFTFGSPIVVTVRADPEIQGRVKLTAIRIDCQGLGRSPVLKSFDATAGTASYVLPDPPVGERAVSGTAVYANGARRDSATSRFSVCRMTIDVSKWQPHTVYVGDSVHCRLVAVIRPPITDLSLFVTYRWKPGKVWRSDDGDKDPFLPYQKPLTIGLQQGEYKTNCWTSISDEGSFIYSVTCEATIHSAETGEPIATLTSIGYIGGDPSDVGDANSAGGSG